MEKISNNLSIYFHWPFCRSKCPYCDFFSRVQKNVNQKELIETYLSQLEAYAKLLPARKIVSVFFGGGTPSLIEPRYIAALLEKINDLWGIASNTEISLEANPNTQTPTLFKDLRQAGINRLSLGVQSLNDDELKFLGRTHTKAEATQAIKDVLKNFDNHSVDLMYALPHQTKESWLKQLEEISALGLKHISLYQLTIEENTVFARKGIKPLAEEKAAALYLATEEYLEQKNYHKYEVSNYAQEGFEAKHNKAYWLGQDYIGIGKTAQGRFKKDGHFFAQTDPLQFEELSPQERAEELVLMGLRLTQGLNKKIFENICGLSFEGFINQNAKKDAINKGLLTEDNQTLKATSKGFLVLDYLILSLCS